MKYRIILIVCAISVLNAKAQNKWKLGPTYLSGMSSLWGSSSGMQGMNMGSGGMPDTKYNLKFSGGAGLKTEYHFSPKWAGIFQGGYISKGTKFDIEAADYTPRYRLNYGDLWLGLKYKMHTENKISPFVSAGGTTSFLLNASRVNSYEAVYISSDVKMFDWGAFASLGIDINLWEKDVLQANLFYASGFQNVFTGAMEMNGSTGKNMFFGLQLSYLIGLKKKSEN